MLSYREYKLNESLLGMGPISLGLRTPNSLGVVGSNLGDETLEEAKKKKKKIKKKMNGDEEIEDEDLEAVEDEEEVDVDVEEEPDEEEVDDEEDVDVEDKEDVDIEVDEEEPILKGACKGKNCTKYMKKEKGKKKKPAKKKMKTEEDQTWWTSVQNMMDSNPNQKFWDGIGPKPGEPGFAPQGRVGDNFS